MTATASGSSEKASYAYSDETCGSSAPESYSLPPIRSSNHSNNPNIGSGPLTGGAGLSTSPRSPPASFLSLGALTTSAFGLARRELPPPGSRKWRSSAVVFDHVVCVHTWALSTATDLSFRLAFGRTLGNLDEEVKTIEAASGATSFISKLWFLLSQPQEFGEYIRWTVKGKAFILSHNSPTFGDAILARFFRHSNVSQDRMIVSSCPSSAEACLSYQIASFVRQLNLYKMSRMSQLALLEDLNDSGSRIDGELTHTGFSHPNLQRGRPELLHLIKRE